MRLFWTLFGKEVMLNLLNFRYQILSVLMLLLIGSSLWANSKVFLADMDRYTQSDAINQERMAESRNLRELFSTQITYMRKPTPTSIYARGLASEIYRSFTTFFRHWGAGIMVGELEDDMPLLVLFLHPDFVFVVGMILSLLALVFSYDAISGEKEEQTLKLVLSYKVSKSMYLLSKWAAGVFCLSLPFICSAALGHAVLTFGIYQHQGEGAVTWTADHTLRLLCVGGLSLFFLSLFYTMGMAVSASTSRASTSLIVCLLVWVIFGLAIPGMGPLLAKQARPAASLSDLDTMKKNTTESLMARLTPEEEAFYRTGGRWQLWRKKQNMASIQAVDKGFRDLSRQSAFSRSWCMTSPICCYLFTATDLMGTGLTQFNRHIDDLTRVKTDYENLAREVIATSHGYATDERVMGLADVPQMTSHHTSVSAVISDNVDLLMLLAALHGLAFFLAYVKFINYNPV